MSSPNLITEVAASGNYPSPRFNTRERVLLESVKTYVDNQTANVFLYKGRWNPNTNTPTLVDGTGSEGWAYWVSAADTGTVAGLADASMINFQVGDLVIYNGSTWQLTTPAAGVSSVNTAQGAVTVNAINQLTGDVTAGPASGSASAASTVAKIQGVTVSGVTGTGNVVMSTSPTLVTPALGTPSAVVLTFGTGLPISTGISGLGTGVATFLATPSSANLASALTTSTGSGLAVFGTSPTLITPALGTPTSGVLSSCTGLPLTTGITGTLGVSNGGTGVGTSTGTGSVVLNTSPSLVTPLLGTPTSGTLTNCTGLTISGLTSIVYATTWLNADGATKTVTHSLGSRDVIVQIVDNNSPYYTLGVESVARTDVNTVTLVSQVAPPVSWRVLVTRVA